MTSRMSTKRCRPASNQGARCSAAEDGRLQALGREYVVLKVGALGQNESFPHANIRQRPPTSANVRQRRQRRNVTQRPNVPWKEFIVYFRLRQASNKARESVESQSSTHGRTVKLSAPSHHHDGQLQSNGPKIAGPTPNVAHQDSSKLLPRPVSHSPRTVAVQSPYCTK
ncbi:hypothetical protein DCS_08133 [Drechmeria coniospora]|uniref:Uncharacterized protein n=1 Tax=Drechmeria coniospora TaxID=98403 RepID=A0A151GGH4_DRECN|nr:hypothetical protein DCS_08133 [Drechmeria coniospora]KYK56166.1 hypothetical protein DCS_08133 [Drechmeria coniospora]